jgi:hypothetical protein
MGDEAPQAPFLLRLRLLSRSDTQPITIGALVRMELDAVNFSGATGGIRLAGPDAPWQWFRVD